MHIDTVMKKEGKKKILSLDGGGIRGMITIEILAKIEKELRVKQGKPALVLSDYFDFVAGTSTGALIAAAICIGMSIDEIRDFYTKSGAEMFDRRLWVPNLGKVMGHEYNSDTLKKTLQEVFGAETTLASEKLKTLLLIVMHNTKTDSPWPVSNNPRAKYNDLDEYGEESNLNLPLWQLLRASTAAPTFFKPETIQIGKDKHTFVDGAMTP
jgi:patatin-like phospholipase/acyl hydrolase